MVAVTAVRNRFELMLSLVPGAPPSTQDSPNMCDIPRLNCRLHVQLPDHGCYSPPWYIWVSSPVSGAIAIPRKQCTDTGHSRGPIILSTIDDYYKKTLVLQITTRTYIQSTQRPHIQHENIDLVQAGQDQSRPQEAQKKSHGSLPNRTASLGCADLNP